MHVVVLSYIGLDAMGVRVGMMAAGAGELIYVHLFM